MSLAGFIASQRTDHGVPHAVTCRMLDISEQWFYKWRDRQPTARQQRRAELDVKVKKVFDDSKRHLRVTAGARRAGRRRRDRR